MSQAHEHDFKTHITILGWLHIISNVLFLVIGLLGFLFMAGIGFASGDPTAVRVLGLIGIIAAVFFAVLALSGLVAGIGLLTRQTWSRVLALVIGFLSLINIPVGTAIGVYTFRLLPGVW